MKPSPESGLRWLRQAEHDIEIAERHHERGDFSDACFMGEQASQKALKGFLIAQGRRSIPIHSVAAKKADPRIGVELSQVACCPLFTPI